VGRSKLLPDINKYAKQLNRYLLDDKATYAAVMNGMREGRLAVGMLGAAMSAFDTYAFLLSKYGPNEHNADRMRNLLKSKYFTEAKYQNADFFYKAIRCAVVHEFFPGAPLELVARDTQSIFLRNPQTCGTVLNAWALYCDVLRGAEKIAADWQSDTRKARKAAEQLQRRINGDNRGAGILVSAKLPELEIASPSTADLPTKPAF
jgi:hypothetical protein